MAAILHANSNTFAFAANTTRYFIPGSDNNQNSAVESANQVLMRTAGLINYLYFRTDANTITATTTFTSRIASGAGNLSISIGASTTGEFEDTTNTDSIAAGQTFGYQMIAGATGTSMTLRYLSHVFTASTDTVKKYSQKVNFTLSTGAVTGYIAFQGVPGSPGATESSYQMKARGHGQFQNGLVRISANTESVAVIFNTRINSVDGTLSVSCTASTTGAFEDTTHTDTVKATDLVNWAVNKAASTGSMTLDTVAVEFLSTGSTALAAGGYFYMLAINTVTTSAQAVNSTAYWQMEGALSSNTTEATKQLKARLPFTASNGFVRLSLNTVTAASTFTLRLTAVDSTLVVSMTASTTGIFEDTTHTVAVAAAKELSWKCVTGATGTSLSVPMAGPLLANNVSSMMEAF